MIGSLWTSQAPAPTTNADGRNDLRLIRTRSGHALTFDDGAKGRVEPRLNGGAHLSIDDAGIVLEDGHGNGLTIQSAAGALTITSTGSMTLKASQISIESSGAIDVKAAATLTLRGALVSIN